MGRRTTFWMLGIVLCIAAPLRAQGEHEHSASSHGADPQASAHAAADMAKAATQLSLNQTQLQAALQVTAGLHQLSLLNYLPIQG